MSDDVILPATGETVAADEIGGAFYQRVKISVGADGTASDLLFGQAAMASSFPVTIASNQTAISIVGANYDTAAALSGQITGLGVGTAVQGTSISLSNGVFMKPHPSNVGTVWVGNTGAGTVGVNSGFPLNTGEAIFAQVSNLNKIWFDMPVTDKVCWMAG
jgi:hypothetical protein